ncbi:MAG: ABC transporter ATP-binding protein/permease [Clostridium beijerinckii]|jgi:ATP-binding cassette subfamily C protein|nr:ABC transporter ATP-binding protein/permease [Clostridium beijerinckii]MCI1578281.1 ABC transporter ATP-binding protein/permease [Clostridium beijerinckii]MCI1586196.1 ABC transporter ATP-binding protein/permease [Clostridium beijerinckii]MCI1621480.1 ABC transporter ATP-binding protein/permease [Clostridium beijerinckii]
MNILKFSIQYFNKFKLSIYLAISLILWSISIYLPLINGDFIDVLTGKNLKLSVYGILIIISTLSILRILLTYILNILYVKLLSKTTFEISYHILDHIKKLPIFFFYNQNAAYLNQRVNTDSTAVSEFSINQIKNLIFNILSLAISSVILIKINLKISSVLIILIPIYLILYFFFKKKLYKANFKYKESQNLYFGEINSQLESIKFIKFNSLFSILNKNLKNKFSIVFSDTIELAKVNNMFSNSGMLVTVMANILILILGVQQIVNGELSIGQFTVIGTYFNTIISGIDYCLSFLETYQNVLVSYNRIEEILGLESEVNGINNIQSIENILIEDLSFKYPDGKNIVSNLNCELKKGFIYRLKGENGVGKSSIINIITGLYNGEYDGAVKYNGINILDFNMYKVRGNLIGVVEQEPTLLKDSILNNITYNLDDYNINVLENSVNKFKLDKFISRLKDGLNTNISERSCNISGGEKQKISIIRTLLKNPDVIILDEANSALDFDSTFQLNSILKKEKENKIIILVSHNTAFDEIVDFEIELGS